MRHLVVSERALSVSVKGARTIVRVSITLLSSLHRIRLVSYSTYHVVGLKRETFAAPNFCEGNAKLCATSVRLCPIYRPRGARQSDLVESEGE
jgi:hypothetical protein